MLVSSIWSSFKRLSFFSYVRRMCSASIVACDLTPHPGTAVVTPNLESSSDTFTDKQHSFHLASCCYFAYTLAQASLYSYLTPSTTASLIRPSLSLTTRSFTSLCSSAHYLKDIRLLFLLQLTTASILEST